MFSTFVKVFFKLAFVCLILALPLLGFAMTTTNVQPSNLVQSNRTVVTATFTTAATLPATGKIKVTFPAGYNVAGATTGACSTINGALLTSVSGQTVTLTRDGSGSAELAGAQICTIAGIQNPSSLGSTGTYTIQITDASDTILDQDIAVTADTIIAPGTIVTANIQPENQVELTRSRQTISYTSINTLPFDGRIQITFPAGYDVSGANSPTCSTMDDGFSVTTTGQVVTIIRGGSGTNQTAAAETCTVNGIKAPAAGTPSAYQIQTQDVLGNPIDNIASVTPDPFFVAPALTSTNVQPASLVAGATSVATVTFTTATTTPIGAKVRVTFPSGFSTASVSAVACASILGTETFTTSTNSVDILTALALGEAAGVESCTITGVRNPMVSGSTGTYSIEVLDESTPGAVVSAETAVAADTITNGVLTATDIIPENLVVSSTQMHTITFTTANPIPGDGRVVVTYPAGFDTTLANSATCVGMNGSILTTTSTGQVILTRTGGSTTASVQAVECLVKDIRNRNTAGASGVYNVTTTNALGVVIDAANPASDTYIATTALTTLNVQPVSLVQNVISDHDITFTSSVAVPQEGQISVQYGVGYDVSGATSGTCTGFDGSLTTATSSGNTVVLMRGSTGTTASSGAKTCRIFGVMNPAATGSTGIYTIRLLDKTGVVLGTATTTADTIIAPGALTSTDLQYTSLVAGATTTATFLFTYPNGLPSDARLHLDFPNGFRTSGASQVTCAGVNGGVSVAASGTQSLIVTRDGTAAGTAAGSVSCAVTSVKNRVASGSTGTYSLAVRDSAATLISSATIAADTFTADALTATDLIPDTRLVQATSSYQIVFTTKNSLPSDGKIKILFPAGFDVSTVSSTAMSCPLLDGIITTSVSGQTVIGTRSGGTNSAENMALACGVSGVRSPITSGLAGTYTVQTADATDATIDLISGVAGDTFAASGTLTTTNVLPGNFRVNELTNHMIDFTQTLGIPRDGSIHIIYPAGFNVSAANSGTCTGMDGSFTTSVSGTTVILTRSGGTGKQAGSETCQIYTINSPTATGDAGTYTIATYTGLGQLIEQDNAVGTDSFTSGSGGASVGGGGGGGGGGAFFPFSNTSQSTTDGSQLTMIAQRVAKLPAPVHSLVKLANDGNVKTQEDSAVYYVGADGLRHAFFDLKVFSSWYCDFSNVKIVTAAQLASMGLGKNVPYRPGVRLVKFTTDPKVYVVLKGAVLAPISDEALARQLYGDTWNKMINDLPDTAYTEYTFVATPAIAALQSTLLQKSVLYPSDSLGIPGYKEEVASEGLSCSIPLSTTTAISFPGFKKPSSIPSTFRFSQTMSSSSPTSDEIRYLQLVLSALGTSIYPEQRVTGNFGPATEQAVKNFQTSEGLSPTGMVAELTRAKLNALLQR